MTLGVLRRAELKSIWWHEAQSFTPWLADNMDTLSQVLGMDLEVTKREYRIGRFSLDILAKDIPSGRVVAIENQLEETDHNHLGQLLTYAAGVEAAVVVWIAKSFCEEHRQTLDWLNHGEGDTEYFGVILELLQIDDSKPAVNFKVIASPNKWSREKRKESSGIQAGTSGKSERYREFFQSLIDELRDSYSFTNSRTAQPQNWFTFSSGTTDIVYAAVFTGKAQLRAEIYIDLGTEAQNVCVMEYLRSHTVFTSERLPEEVEWDWVSGRRACRIAVYRSGTIANSTVETQQEYRKWFVDRLLFLKRVFGPVIPEGAKHAFTDTSPVHASFESSPPELPMEA